MGFHPRRKPRLKNVRRYERTRTAPSERGFLRTPCNAPRDVRAAYQSTAPFFEWEMSLSKREKSLAFDVIELLLDQHANALRKVGWKLSQGQSVLSQRRVSGTSITVGTICWGASARTVLGLTYEFRDW